MWWRKQGFWVVVALFGLVMPLWTAVLRNGCALQLAPQVVRNVDLGQYPLPVLWEKSPCSIRVGGWIGGRAFLASENINLAQTHLTAVQAQYPSNPLLLADTVVALSEDEQYEEVIALFQQTTDNPAHELPRVNEAVAWAFMQMGNWDEAQTLLPEHIIPLYWQWQNGGDTAVYAALQDVTIARVNAADRRLAMATIELLPELVEQEVWSADLAAQVHDFVAWQHGLARPLPLPSAKPPSDWATHGLIEADLGENMLPHSQFTSVQGARPQGWQFGNYVAPPDDSRFIGGLDGLAVRLMGLDEAQSIAGFMALVNQPSEGTGSYFLTLEPEQLYYISGWYATATVGEWASIYMGSRAAVALNQPLPATDGQWRWVSFPTCGLSSEAGQAQIVFRLESTGSLWLANWSVQPVLSSSRPCIRP